MSSDPEPVKGDEYHHPDGTAEVVFATEGKRVLVVKEYPEVNQFTDAVADAEYRGVNEEIAALPPAESFVESTEDP